MTGTFKEFIEKTNLLPNEVKVGDKVEDCNKDCKHYNSKGTVVGVSKIKGKGDNIIGNKVKYKCNNSGKTWDKNDELEKTEIQLKKIKKS